MSSLSVSLSPHYQDLSFPWGTSGSSFFLLYNQCFFFSSFVFIEGGGGLPLSLDEFTYLESTFLMNIPGVSKKYPNLAGNSSETIRHYYSYSPSGQLNSSIFNLGSHTLHLEIVHQTPEMQAYKVKTYSPSETRDYENGLAMICIIQFSKAPSKL